jgi:hypothetical protein
LLGFSLFAKGAFVGKVLNEMSGSVVQRQAITAFLSLNINSLTSFDRKERFHIPRIVPKLSGSGIRVLVSSPYVMKNMI